ncbi:hypothetical protein ACLB2K_031948 [Fragaria x ananassa]
MRGEARRVMQGEARSGRVRRGEASVASEAGRGEASDVGQGETSEARRGEEWTSETRPLRRERNTRTEKVTQGREREFEFSVNCNLQEGVPGMLDSFFWVQLMSGSARFNK